MNRLRRAVVVLGIASLFIAGAEASAQQRRGGGRSSYGARLRRPPVSPYLNLFREDTGPLPNYHTLVRPQLEQQKANFEQQRQINALRQQLTTGTQPQAQTAVPPTGHPSTFQNLSHFYQKRARAGRRY